MKQRMIAFEVQLIEMDLERDHVHRLVSYPPKVPVSAMVKDHISGTADATYTLKSPSTDQRKEAFS